MIKPKKELRRYHYLACQCRIYSQNLQSEAYRKMGSRPDVIQRARAQLRRWQTHLNEEKARLLILDIDIPED